MKFRFTYIPVIVLVMSVWQAKADVFVPLLENDKEWGYVEYIPNAESSPNSYVDYYRLQLSGTCDVGQFSYKKVKTDSSFGKAEEHYIALMREDNGKVYARYTEESKLDPYNYYYPGEEYLLYDFSMQPGESIELAKRTGDTQGIVLKCIETGEVDTESGKRKYLKFDRNVNETTRRYMTFDYIVEGIGPVGNGIMALPYRASVDGVDSDFPEIDFLYQRQILPEVNFRKPQGELLYVSPLFEVKGPYDPSVWFWKRVCESPHYSSVSDTKRDSLGDLGITLHGNGINSNTIESEAEYLTEVTVFDTIGKVLAKYHPNSRKFSLNLSDFDSKIVIIRASTAKSTRSFKVLL